MRSKGIYFILVLVVAVLVGLFVLGNRGSTKNASTDLAPAIDGIRCESEMVQVHYHTHLALFQDGKEVSVPAQIGIQESPQCLYWLHTHQTDGIIHIESPKDITFNLGNFFNVWKQTLSDSEAGPVKAATGQKLTIFVDGQPYTGDPKAITLKAHELIVIEAGQTVPPPAYTFPPNV